MSFRKTLLVIATATVIVICNEHEAKSVIPVTCDNCLEQISWTIETGKELSNMVSQLEQLKQVYSSLSGVSNIGGLTSALGVPLISNPLASVTSGNFNTGSVTGALSGLARQFRNSDNYYLPQSNTGGLLGNLLNGRADMLANIKAAATQLFDGSQSRITALQALRDQVGQTTTLKEAQDLNNQIASAEADIANQQGQIQQLTMLASIQREQGEEKMRQYVYKSSETWYNQTRPID